ncbi:MAG: OsmC family protein [Alphaproteobacteria bacterium]|nr:OsmC family protein [Alphaproteobacteria bacterium]
MAEAQAKKTESRVNGLDLDALANVVEEIQKDPAKAKVAFRVTSAWKGQTKSEAKVTSYTLGGEEIKRNFTIPVDEPLELLGENTAPNPQEVLMTALNACIMVGYVAGAAVNGITLEKVEIETFGELDLRGFLGLDEKVKPGYDSIRYEVRIKGSGTPEQFQEIHENVIKTSPNYFNVSQPIRLDATLKVES